MFICKLSKILKERNLKKTSFALDNGFPKTFIENLVSNKFRDINMESLERVMQILDITRLEDILIYVPYEIEIGDTYESKTQEESYVLGFKDISIDVILKNKEGAKTLTTLIRIPHGEMRSNVMLLSIGSIEDIVERDKWLDFFYEYDPYFLYYVLARVAEQARKEFKIKNFVTSSSLQINKK